MKKIILIILICILFLFACDNSSKDSDVLTNEETLAPTIKEETFVPSNNEEEINLKIYDTILKEAKDYIAIANKNYSINSLEKKEHKGYDFVGFSYLEHGEIIKKSSISFDSDTTLFANYKINEDFFMIDNISDVYIECSTSITSKEAYNNAKIKIDDKKYPIDSDVLIRLRGNSTFHVAKKSYKLKFNEKVDLFGMGKDKEWALLANYFDPTYMRNFYAYRFAEALGLEYSIQTKYVNLYLNKEYVGIYLLTETVKTSKNRVNIEKQNLNESEVPFLLELDMKIVQDNPNYYEILDDEAFILDNMDYNGKRYPFATKYPKSFKDLTTDQYKYIKDYMFNVYESVRSGNFIEYIDLDSFMNYFIIQELFMNVDLDYSSVFMYKPFGEKLHFGPIWDFDLSSGNVSYLNNYHPYSTMLQSNGGNYLFEEAIKNKDFNKMVTDRIKEIEDIVNAMLESIYDNYSILQGYYFLDNSIWNVLNDHNWARPNHLVGISYNEQVVYFKNYISDHYKWLKNINL